MVRASAGENMSTNLSEAQEVLQGVSKVTLKGATRGKSVITSTVLIAALGYFVDIYDLLLLDRKSVV